MFESAICRLCLLTSSTVIEINSEIGQQMDLMHLLNMHFGLTINNDEMFTTLICKACVNKINDFHVFYEQVITNHQRMLSKEMTEENADDIHILDVEIEKANLIPLQEVEEEDNYISDCDTKLVPKKTKTKKIIKRKRHKESGYEKLDEQIKEFFKLECDICTDRPVFETFRLIVSHYKMVHGIRGYVTCCNKKFFRRCRVLYHLMNHLQPDAYKCKICDKILSGKATLALHMDLHIPNEERPLKCPECPLRFVRRQYLNQHQITHLAPEQKKHVCEECGKAFGLKSILLTHTKSVHTKVKEHICDVCAKSFKTKDGFVKHRHTHDEGGVFRVQCQQCDAWLKNTGCLRVHTESVHRGGTFPCLQCGKLSPSKRALRVHEKYVHTDIKPFICTVCPKEFKKRSELREHTASHTGEVLYRCPYCPATFAANSNFSCHKKKMHRNEITTLETIVKSNCF